MKVPRKCKVTIFIVSVIILIATALHVFGLDVFSDRASLRHALGLHRLPFTTSISHVESESWTDYSFFCRFSYSSGSEDYITSGRDFKLSEKLARPRSIVTQNAKEFIYTDLYVWDVYDDEGALARLYLNSNSSEAYVVFLAD